MACKAQLGLMETSSSPPQAAEFRELGSEATKAWRSRGQHGTPGCEGCGGLGAQAAEARPRLDPRHRLYALAIHGVHACTA